MTAFYFDSHCRSAEEYSSLFSALLEPSAIPCRLLLYFISTVFSDWRRTVSSQFFDTQVPSVSTEELVLPHHVCCFLSRLCCNGLRLLLTLSFYLTGIGRIEIFFCSACGHSFLDVSHCALSSYGVFPARTLATLCLCELWCRPWEVALGVLGLHGFPPCPHPSEGVG